MAVNLSPVAGAAAQFFDNSGNVLTGGKLYTYDAGTTTPAPTYTSSNGATAHPNPIILNAAGRVPDSGEIWLADSVSYKFVLKDTNDVLIGTYDNLVGINSNFVNFTGEEEQQTATQGQTVFTLTTLTYQPTTNNLLVFVNGSKQISGVNYQETSSTVVTFVDGLNVGDVVDFCTATPINTNVVTAAAVVYNEGCAGAIDRSVESKLQESISAADFANFDDALVCAEDKSLLVQTAISISSNTTVPATVQLIVENGALFTIDTGVTLTIEGPFQAGVYQIFDCVGTGEVVFTNQLTGYPEWWGAVINDSGADCTAAINAAIVALPITQFQSADYYIADTIYLTTNGRTLQGNAWGYLAGTGTQTRICMADATKTLMYVGQLSDPGSIGGGLAGTTVNQISFVRTVALTLGSTPIYGVVVKWTLFTYFSKVNSWDSQYGFYMGATCRTYFTDCYSARTLAASNAGTLTDEFVGYYLDGAISFGAAGGNASTYFADSTAGCGVPALTTSNSRGFLLATAGADTFINRCEVTTCSIGVEIVGSAGGAKAQSGDADIHVNEVIVDGFTQWGLHILDLSVYAAIDVSNSYFAPGSGAAATAGIGIVDCAGPVSLVNNQVIGWPTALLGLFIDSSIMVSSVNNIYNACTNGAILLTSAQGCRIEDTCNGAANPSTNAAVTLTTSSNRNYIAPIINGGANVWATGVNLSGSTNTYNEVNCTAMVPTSITGGSANKLVINGVQITTTGLTGTNLASGIMA